MKSLRIILKDFIEAILKDFLTVYLVHNSNSKMWKGYNLKCSNEHDLCDIPRDMVFIKISNGTT